MNDTKTEVNIAAVAELLADSSRAAMLDALLGKQALPADELAYCAVTSHRQQALTWQSWSQVDYLP